LINGNDLSVMGKHHGSEHKRGHCLHSMHVAMTKQNIVGEWGIDNLNVNKDSFSPEFDGDILEEPLERQGSSIVSPQSNSGWY
jgi:hypothetical protein